jgi:hypothetical protein
MQKLLSTKWLISPNEYLLSAMSNAGHKNGFHFIIDGHGPLKQEIVMSGKGQDMLSSQMQRMLRIASKMQ